MSAEPIIERLRQLQADHAPEGWPAVQMRDITALLDELELTRWALDEAREDSLRWIEKLNNVHVSARAHRDKIGQLHALLKAIADKRHTYGWGPEADAAIDAARLALVPTRAATAPAA